MKKHTLNFLLLFLRGLIQLKRGGVWVGKIFYRGFEGLLGGFWRIVGFRLGKISFFLQRNFGWAKVPWQDQLGELLSRRGSLQVILLVICFFVLYPQTKLFTKDAFNSPGQKTLLYALVGPGDQDYGLEEVIYSENIVIDKSAASWKDSAVSAGVSAGVGDNNKTNPVDIAGVSTGGLALTKPTILPGSTLPTEVAVNTGRTEIVVYEVLPGDVIGQIAEKFGIDVATILWANNLTARSYIRPGDKLKILPVSGITHTVKKGESISKIARLYGVSDDEIVKANQLQRDGSDISIGENLIIPGGKIIVPIVTKVLVANNKASIRQVAAPPPSVSAPAGSGYIWPTAAHIITQYFGFRHTGLDIASKIGTPNYAARAGTVVKSQCGWNGGYGCYIIIDHGGGVQTLYGHHSQLYVSVGDKVVQGQTIGLMGSTGKSTGPHLHFEVRINGKVQNPLKYIRL